MIKSPQTGLDIGDPERLPFDPTALPAASDARASAESLILSASGWRKVFSSDGNENSMTEAISAPDALISALAAMVWADWLIEGGVCGPDGPALVLGIDSRPTGPAIADVMARVFLSRGLGLHYLFIVSAPEIMAYAASAAALPSGDAGRAGAFCYVSASHNPPGHNGLKFGLGDGGVLSKEAAEELIASYRAALADQAACAAAIGLAQGADRHALSRVYSDCAHWKRRSHSAYLLFCRRVVTGSEDLDEQEDVLDRLSRTLRRRPIGVLAEMNGSARSLSPDADFMSSAGLRVRTMNARPREFVHRIVPEGEALETCRHALERVHAEDPAFVLGYVPDCDGDRGNLVSLDPRTGRSSAVEAQEVFALAVLAELAALAWAGFEGKLAVACNDPTSLRIEQVAGAFGARVFRAEVGEANVVNLARELRGDGWTVRILGEGSNGGSIVHPSAVRDPLATVMAVAKLLAIRDEGGRKGLYHLWMERSGQDEQYKDDFTLADVLDSLPPWASTSVFEDRAALRISCRDQAALKAAYQELFCREWPERKAEFSRRFRASGWRVRGWKGTKQLDDLERFADSGSGGLKIEFTDSGGHAVAAIWMRGSGTEPVFRIMADASGGLREDEEWLLDWQTSLVRQADALASGSPGGKVGR